VALCPSCAVTLESNEDVLFCPNCKLALHERAGFEATLGFSVAPGDLDARVDRLGEPVGRCPACDQGDLWPGRLAGEPVAQCSACAALWVGGAQLARIRAALKGRAAARPQPVGPARPLLLEASQFEYDTPRVNAAALPAALALGVLIQLMGLEILVHATTGMWAHELGHALVAWLSGFVAIPLPFITLQASEDRTLFGACLLMLALAGAAIFAFRQGAWPLLALLAFFAGLQVLLTWSLNPAQATKWVIAAGLGGELVIPTAWMIAFYQRLPGRWDFWRYPVLAASAVTLVRGLFLWTRVVSGTRPMPHGSMVGSDSEGDVERLVRFYHFTEPDLAHGYLTLAWGCLAVLAFVYAFRLRLALAAS
jgi:hypothetical protein